jgi:hypothetical protein
MASPIITPFAAKTETDYRPISRMAIVGLLLSCFSPLLFFVENGIFCLVFFAIPGGIISILARRAILNSEGSLAGESLAILGTVLAVTCGLGWATSRLVSSFVTDMESRQAVDQWIAQLQRGESGAGFLMTLPPHMRANLPFHPENHRQLRQHFPAQAGSESAFDSFIVNPVYSQILRYGDRAHVTYVSRLEGSITRGTSFVRLKYRLETPISSGDLIFIARSEDNSTEQGVLRQWYMYLENPLATIQPTHYGEELAAMINRSYDQIKRFVNAVSKTEENQISDLIDSKSQGNVDYKQLLGYLHPSKESVNIGLRTPLRVRAEQKTDAGWKITLECSAIIMEEREVDFSLVASSDPTGASKWKLSDFKFLGEHKRMTQLPVTVGGGGGEGAPPTKAGD